MIVPIDEIFRAAILGVPEVSDAIGERMSAFNGFAPSTQYPCAQYTRTASSRPTSLDGDIGGMIDGRYDLLFFAQDRATAWAAANAARDARDCWRGDVEIDSEMFRVHGMFMRDAAEVPVVSEDGQDVGDFAVRQQWRIWAG